METRKKTKKRMGRPPLPEADRKSEAIRVRVTKAELRKLQKVAKERGVPVSAVLIAPWRETEGE